MTTAIEDIDVEYSNMSEDMNKEAKNCIRSIFRQHNFGVGNSLIPQNMNDKIAEDIKHHFNQKYHGHWNWQCMVVFGVHPGYKLNGVNYSAVFCVTLSETPADHWDGNTHLPGFPYNDYVFVILFD